MIVELYNVFFRLRQQCKFARDGSSREATCAVEDLEALLDGYKTLSRTAERQEGAKAVYKSLIEEILSRR